MVVIRNREFSGKQLSLDVKISVVKQQILRIKREAWKVKKLALYRVLSTCCFWSLATIFVIAVWFGVRWIIENNTSLVVVFPGLFKLKLFQLTILPCSALLWLVFGGFIFNLILGLVIYKFISKTYYSYITLLIVLLLIVNLIWFKILITRNC